MVDFGMNIQQAVSASRVHHQWLPDEIRWEPFGLNPDTRRVLEAKGHAFREKPGEMGDAHAVMIDPKTGARLGASDPRLGGLPLGY
ncbi:MAG: gamma-glutamyltransferase [Thermoanaerobaculia bacterium]